MARLTKHQPCPTCCPTARVDFDRDGSDWACRNCGHRVAAGPAVTKKLPDEPTMADLTPSQRKAIEGLKRIWDGPNVTWSFYGVGRKVFVGMQEPWGKSQTWLIGPRGGRK